MQERLNCELATDLQEEIDATGVPVETTATHLYEAMRSVKTATESDKNNCGCGEEYDVDERGE